jgi:LmbE family N-acetylglucosaminyl deacetylase
VLYPLDRLSYGVYAGLRGRRIVTEAFELDGSTNRILIVSPHQDDELIGCGGFIVRHAKQRTITVAYVTDGKGGAHRSPEARRALAVQREQESRQVCAMLGIEPVFMGFDDGRVREQTGLTPAFETLLRRLEPDLVMAPFLTDGHRDHAATTLALARAVEALPDAARVALYQVHSHIPDRLLNRCLGLSPEEQEIKERALQHYVSQDMQRRLTRSKYMLFSSVAPQIRRPAGSVSAEHFAVMSGAELRQLYQTWNVDTIVPRLKTINYAPYSFRNYLNNRKLLDRAASTSSGR